LKWSSKYPAIVGLVAVSYCACVMYLRVHSPVALG